jgi:peptidoglycan hydrolase-like protein with peptidoglycan-binding domain
MEPLKLRIGDLGSDVARIQEQLALHGVEVSAEERKQKFFGPSTRDAVRTFQKTNGIDPSCEVCQETAKLLAVNPALTTTIQPNLGSSATSSNDLITTEALVPASVAVPTESDHFMVHGIVRLSDLTPAPEITIRVFDRDLRTRELIGQTTTNFDGYYEVFYTSDQFSRAEKQTADLVVEAVQPLLTAANQYRTLVVSPTLFNAPLTAIIDLVIEANTIPVPSEYDRFMAEIHPLIGNQQMADLREDAEENIETLAFWLVKLALIESGLTFSCWLPSLETKPIYTLPFSMAFSDKIYPQIYLHY